MSSQVQHLIRREKAETFTRTIINQLKHGMQLNIGDLGKVCAFWEKETQKAVDVFVAASLPWGVWIEIGLSLSRISFSRRPSPHGEGGLK